MTMQRTTLLALGSLGVGLLVLAMKFGAWKLTGSLALYSDAMESTVNVAAALGLLLAVKVSAKPADAGHPYGHHKAEYFAAVLEGALIVVAALSIGYAALQGLLRPVVPDFGWAGLAVNAAASAVNGWWCWVLIGEGRRLRSPALVADGRHILSDVVGSAGILGGLVLAWGTGWVWLDPLLALLVAVNIVWSGVRLIVESVDGLMDAALPKHQLDKVEALLAADIGGALEGHDLRTRQAGARMFVEFHLVVPGEWSVRQAHALCDVLEGKIKQALGASVLVTIHIEPEEKAKLQPA